MRFLVPQCPRAIPSLGGLLVAGLLVGGCGYSATDEYARIHSITVPAQPGDGSVIASINGRATQPGLAREVAARDQERGRVIDMTATGN